MTFDRPALIGSIRISAGVSTCFLTAAAGIFLLAAPAAGVPCTENGECLPRGVVIIPGSPGSNNPGAPPGAGPGRTDPGPGCGATGGVGTCPLGDGAGAPPALAPIPTITLAFSARDALEFPAPRIHTAPAPKTFVQVRTNLWITPGTTFVSMPERLNVPGQSVHATAKLESVVWNLGERTITCNSPGSKQSSSCSYTYNRSSAGQPGGKYHLTATANWKVSWTCTGGGCDAPGGTFDDPVPMAGSSDLPVGEIQTNSQPT